MNRRKIIIASPDRKRRKRKKNVLKALLFFLGVCAVVALVIMFFRSPYLRINTITVAGAKEISKEDLTYFIQSESAGNYYYVFPKNHILLYPKKKIIADLHAKYPQIIHSGINFKNTNTVTLSIKERAPIALYCVDKCYFIDELGFVYKESPDFSSDVYRVYRDYREIYASSTIATSTPIGRTPLSLELFKNINTFVDNLSTIKLTPLQVSIMGNQEIQILTKQGNLKVSLRNPLSNQFEILKTAVDQPSFSDGKGGVTHFQYIDVRFGSKIFYKL